jgi:hypothetical protein
MQGALLQLAVYICAFSKAARDLEEKDVEYAQVERSLYQGDLQSFGCG